MDNINKFEDFLDRMQGLLDNAKKQGHILVRVEDLENTFPELKESEDEKIRKALLELVHDTTGDELWVDYNFHKEDAIAWLEKQGEQKPNYTTLVETGNGGINALVTRELPTDGEQKPAWTKEDEDRLTSCIEAITACYQWDSMIEWLKSLKERVHPKQEWSEKDEEELEIAIDTLKESGRYDSAKWVQSLKQRIGG